MGERERESWFSPLDPTLRVGAATGNSGTPGSSWGEEEGEKHIEAEARSFGSVESLPSVYNREPLGGLLREFVEECVSCSAGGFKCTRLCIPLRSLPLGWISGRLAVFPDRVIQQGTGLILVIVEVMGKPHLLNV